MAGGRDRGEAVVAKESVEVSVGDEAGLVVVSRHGGLEVGALCMLALALVGILMAAEGLRRREIATAVVALEFSPTLSTTSTTVVMGGDRVGGALMGGTGIGGGGVGVLGWFFLRGVGLMGEVDAKDPDGSAGIGGPVPSRRRGPEEGELREGVDGHEVLGLSLAHGSVADGHHPSSTSH